MRKSNYKSYLYCNDNDNDNNEIISNLRGKERRALRAIANRMKQDLSLLQLPCSVSYNENFIKNHNAIYLNSRKFLSENNITNNF